MPAGWLVPACLTFCKGISVPKMLQFNTKLDPPHSKRLLCPRLPYPMASVYHSTNVFGDPLRSPQLVAGLRGTSPHPTALQPTRNEERSLPGQARERLRRHCQPGAPLPSSPLPPLLLLVRAEIAKPTKLMSNRFKAEQFNPCLQQPGRFPASCRPAPGMLRRPPPCRGPRGTPTRLPGRGGWGGAQLGHTGGRSSLRRLQSGSPMQKPASQLCEEEAPPGRGPSPVTPPWPAEMVGTQRGAGTAGGADSRRQGTGKHLRGETSVPQQPQSATPEVWWPRDWVLASLTGMCLLTA